MRIIGNDPSTPRQAQVVASGTLSTGDTVVVNSDGTVSVVAETEQTGAGSPTVFSAVSASNISATFDSNANKVVVAYSDGANSSYGTAVVGTVSGTSISFGTPSVFESASTFWTGSTFDSNSNKVVVAYSDGGNSFSGTAIVGTISGTSISFGSAAVFDASGTVRYSDATFDSNSNKVVVAYGDGGNSGYGTAIVGTVSGTSISFGSATVFETGFVGEELSVAFDSNSNKVVVAYSESGGKAVVGTVSGTSISFGTPVVFNGSSTEYTSVAFDGASNKIVIAYHDNGNSSFGTAIVGTVSGTSISFGTPVVFESDVSTYISCSAYSAVNGVVITYHDNGNSGYGTAVVGTVSGTSISFNSPFVFSAANTEQTNAVPANSAGDAVVFFRDIGNSNYGTSSVIGDVLTTNLTAENYIGTAASGAADTQRAKINLKGAVDENQSGLTAGQSYYVQTDGTLGTTPADPSVFAGTAVGATKLIVKG